MNRMKASVFRKVCTGLTLGLFVLMHNVDCLAQSSEWASGKYMQQALANVVAKATIVTVASDSRYDLDDNGVSLLGAFLDEGAQVGWTTTLYQGNTYVIIGGGDEDTKDLDIKVYDSNGNLVVEDVKTDNTPIVEVRPSRTARYTIRLKLYDAHRSSFCAMAILRDGVRTIPLDRVVKAMDRYMGVAEVVRILAGGARFHEENNQWALYGAILNEGESTTISNITLESREHAILAAGDNRSRDADLYLYNGNGDELEKDTETDPTPIISRRTSSRMTYKLKIKNFDSNGHSLILATILDI